MQAKKAVKFPTASFKNILPWEQKKDKRSDNEDTGINTPSSSLKCKDPNYNLNLGSSEENNVELDNRLKKNRESAWRSRLKKKQQLRDLQNKYNCMLAENIKTQQKVSLFKLWYDAKWRCLCHFSPLFCQIS